MVHSILLTLFTEEVVLAEFRNRDSPRKDRCYRSAFWKILKMTLHFLKAFIIVLIDLGAECQC